jgi:pyruvate kinase
MNGPRTKIVCTLGSRDVLDPSIPQNDADFIRRLAFEGMSVARLNLSHNLAWENGRSEEGYGSEDGWLERIDAANAALEGVGEPRRVAALADLQGVKIRLALPTAWRKEGWLLEPGARVDIGLGRGEPTPTVDGGPALVEDVRRGIAASPLESLMIHLGDGETVLRVLHVDDAGRLHAEVVVGGVLHDRKGVTFRGVGVTVDTVLTAKDRHDLAHWVLPRMLEGRVTLIALSFVRGPADILALRSFVAGLLSTAGGPSVAANDSMAAEGRRFALEDSRVQQRLTRAHAQWASGTEHGRDEGFRPSIVAKIETREAAGAGEAILREADAVMVARGDLGLQCEPQDVPRIQKNLLAAASRAGKPSIVATQMLGSMERFYEPRRPEASDVFNAVLDGADAVMLSGETSVGVYPVRSVQVLRGIVEAAESFASDTPSGPTADAARFYDAVREDRVWRGASAAITDHVSFLAATAVRSLKGKAVVALTLSGGTARMVSRFRVPVPVVAVVHDATTARRLALSYGVVPVEAPVLPAGTPVDEAVTAALRVLVERRILESGDTVVVLCGRPLGGATGTNLLSVETLT